MTSNLSQGSCASKGWHTKWRSHVTDFLINSRLDRVFLRSCLEILFVEALDWGLSLWPLWTKRRGTHHFLDLSLGAGFLGMRNRALIGCMSQRAVEKERRTLTLDVLCWLTLSTTSQPNQKDKYPWECLDAETYSLKLKQKSRMHISVFYSLWNTYFQCSHNDTHSKCA